MVRPWHSTAQPGGRCRAFHQGFSSRTDNAIGDERVASTPQVTRPPTERGSAMGVRMMDLLTGKLDTLRYEPTAKRVRAYVGGEPVADTCEALLVWEPRRVVPTYAVPLAALTAQLVPAGAESGADEDVGVRLPAISS